MPALPSPIKYEAELFDVFVFVLIATSDGIVDEGVKLTARWMILIMRTVCVE